MPTVLFFAEAAATAMAAHVEVLKHLHDVLVQFARSLNHLDHDGRLQKHAIGQRRYERRCARAALRDGQRRRKPGRKHLLR